MMLGYADVRICGYADVRMWGYDMRICRWLNCDLEGCYDVVML